MPLAPALLEPRIRAIGEDLARRSGGQAPSLFDSSWWTPDSVRESYRPYRLESDLGLRPHECFTAYDSMRTRPALSH